MFTGLSSPHLLLLATVTLTCSAVADKLYRLTDSAGIPVDLAEKKTVAYQNGLATININDRRNEYTIAVNNGNPLKFSVGNAHNCKHADMITFSIDDKQPKKSDDKNPYGLHFLWRQIGGHFEVHQSDRDAASKPIDLDWAEGTKATVTAKDDQVTADLQKKTQSQKLCLRESNTTCSFVRSEKEFEGGDVFRLQFATLNDRRCGIFVELNALDGHLLFPESKRPSGATTHTLTPLTTAPSSSTEHSPSSSVSSSTMPSSTTSRASSYKHYSGLLTAACLTVAFMH